MGKAVIQFGTIAMVDDELIAEDVTVGGTNPTEFCGIVFKPLQMNVD